jgi:hypothetical protein
MVSYACITYGADDHVPGFNIKLDGIDEAVADVASQAFTNAAKQLKDSTIPALEQAVNNNLDKAEEVLTRVVRNAQPELKKTVHDGLAYAAQSALLSTAGLIITSAGIMLVYQGLKADSEQENDAPSKKVNTTKLLGYGGGLIIIGVATMMHMSIRNAFNTSKV